MADINYTDYKSDNQYLRDIAGLSMSNNYTDYKSDNELLKIISENGTGATGTGFPNGVVSAPVGSIYIDTAVTNGASSWIKKSGTGNTGWQVLEGDTGWRDITADLTNGWTGTASLLVRRMGTVVEIRLIGISDATATSPRLLAGINMGFRPERTPVYSTIGIMTSTYPTSLARAYIDIYGDIYANTARPTASTFSGSLTFNTNRAWPTTLPGTT